MPLFYPSFDAFRLADSLVDQIGQRSEGYQGRIGAAWYWHMAGGILVAAALDHTVTEERWDVLRAQASTPLAGVFTRAEFPFRAYGTSATSPPFIHDLKGVAEWSNRLYFQMGQLIEDAVHWLGLLRAVSISPRVHPPASFPTLSRLERRLVQYTLEELDGAFSLRELHAAFAGEVSRARLAQVARAWESAGLLTERPRRVTYALQALAEDEVGEKA
ncbi:MAG: hypothetical protein GX601_01830 [Anaerolineales bacterium]|nr:hypothetical protein [Anaerolineales bacterium]